MTGLKEAEPFLKSVTVLSLIEMQSSELTWDTVWCTVDSATSVGYYSHYASTQYCLMSIGLQLHSIAVGIQLITDLAMQLTNLFIVTAFKI